MPGGPYTGEFDTTSLGIGMGKNWHWDNFYQKAGMRFIISDLKDPVLKNSSGDEEIITLPLGVGAGVGVIYEIGIAF